jgi:acetone carboxylase gamma subunit
MAKVRVTESLDIDLDSEKWCCHRCGVAMASAREPFMKGALLYEKPASEIYGDAIKLSGDTSISYSPDPDFMRIIEFYCPGCGALISVQYLPPGHPIPNEIQLDIDRLKARHAKEANPQA